jgi:hypothetical protein
MELAQDYVQSSGISGVEPSGSATTVLARQVDNTLKIYFSLPYPQGLNVIKRSRKT